MTRNDGVGFETVVLMYLNRVFSLNWSLSPSTWNDEIVDLLIFGRFGHDAATDLISRGDVETHKLLRDGGRVSTHPP